MLSVKAAGDSLKSIAADENALNNIVQLIDAGEEGKYYVKIQGRGMIVPPGNASQGAKIQVTEDNGHKFMVVSRTEEPMKFYFADAESTDQTYNCLHDDGKGEGEGKNIVGWTKDQDPSQWYLLPVKTVSVTLNAATTDNKKYATLGLPFNAQVTTEGVTVYQGENKGSYVQMTEVADKIIPANEGVVLVSETETSVTLNVANPAATADFENNCLEATCVQMSGATYVFGEDADEGVGFYTLAADGTLAPNRAYITKTASNAAMRLVFGGNLTGIDAVDNGELTIDNAPVYDLSGRVVNAPTKGGVYIKNGKKFIVK